jgi:hypothetical protein
MRTQAFPKLESSVAKRLGMCAAALAGTAGMVSHAQAELVTFTTPISVPNTFSGVYINFLTGASATTPGAVPGWDFGPWGSSGTLSFFWNASPANSSGGVASTTSGPYLSLGQGVDISAASTFSAVAASAQVTAFHTPGTHTLGFRFFNESTAAVNYGYLSITTGAASGFPATINGWTFDNAGGMVTTPVPEPATALMLSMGALALGAMHLRRVRRERRQDATH